MNNEYQNQMSVLIQNAHKIAVIPSKVGGNDSFAAAVAMYHMLKAKEKNVSLIYPGQIPDGFEDVITPSEVTSEIGHRELVVAIDYSDTPASKVHYSTQNDILYLSISPINKNFSFSKIHSSIKGFDFDLIIAVGAQVPQDFGQTYTELEEDFRSAVIANIDNTERNSRYGKLNIIDVTAESLCMLVLSKFTDWRLKLSQKAAMALLSSIGAKKMI